MPAAAPEAKAKAKAKANPKRAARARAKATVAQTRTHYTWDPSDEALLTLPPLVLTMDQGSVGWSAQFFLIYVLGCNLCPLWDLSHRVWNDAKGAVFAIPPLYEALCSSLHVMNLDMGPYESYAWWGQTKEAVQAFHEQSDEKDPLWQFYLKAILRDLGEEDKLLDATFCKALWDQLPSSEAFTRHLPKVGFTRWFGWVQSFQQGLDKAWHKKLVVLIWLGLQMGTLKKGMAKAMDLGAKRPPPVDAEGEPLPGTTGGRENSKLGQLRTACRNKVHVCTILLLDTTLQLRCRLIASVLGFLDKWHGDRNSANRDPQACMTHFLKQSAGEGLEPLNKAVGILTDTAKLEYIGYVCYPSPVQAAFPFEHPAVQQENAHSELLALLLVHVLRKRCQSVLWDMWGVPGLFLGLLDPVRKALTLEKLKNARGLAEGSGQRSEPGLGEDPGQVLL